MWGSVLTQLFGCYTTFSRLMVLVSDVHLILETVLDKIKTTRYTFSSNKTFLTVFFYRIVPYVAWRVMNGLHRSIELSFMLVCHTKFSPGWCFGLLKQCFRVSKVNCLDHLMDVVNTSATPNEVQLVGSQAGEPIVPMYDWVEFFESFHLKKVPLIT